MKREAYKERMGEGTVVSLPGVELRLTAEHALRAAIDNQVFATLRELEPLDGGRAVQSVYVALIRRLPNVSPDRKRIAIDTGFSESSVKRAIKLLERCRVISVKREPGKGSHFHLADIRAAEVASECVSAIRRLARSEGRVTSEPTPRDGRATCEPGSRVTNEPGVGSLLTQKESTKVQNKQQGAAAELFGVLSKWGLSSASYLVTPGHERAIPLLAEFPAEAARLIDRAMRKVPWSASAGVGARVSFLRENIGETAREWARLSEPEGNRERAMRRATKVASELRRDGADEFIEVHAEQFSELLARGLGRLAEPPEVLEALAADAAASRAIVREELLRVAAESRVDAMVDGEFEDACEELFATNPGLRKLYPEKGRASTGLRLRLIEFLREKSGRSDDFAGRGGRKEGFGETWNDGSPTHAGR